MDSNFGWEKQHAQAGEMGGIFGKPHWTQPTPGHQLLLGFMTLSLYCLSSWVICHYLVSALEPDCRVADPASATD